MELKIISNEEYDTIIHKLDELIGLFDKNLKKEANPLNERWLDSSDVAKILKITPRTLQNYRDRRILPFSQIGPKIYYKASDIENYLNDHYSS